MCGRYAIYSKKKIKDIYNVDIEPNYNVSPGSNILVLDCDNVPRKMIWKFFPIWGKKDFNIINASHDFSNFEKSHFRRSDSFKISENKNLSGGGG